MNTKPWLALAFMVAAAELMPLADANQPTLLNDSTAGDVTTCTGVVIEEHRSSGRSETLQ